MEYEVSRVLTCKLPPHQQDRPGSLSYSVFLIKKKKKISFLPQPAMPLPTDAFPTKRTSIFYLPWQVSTCFPVPPSAAWPPQLPIWPSMIARPIRLPSSRKGAPLLIQKEMQRSKEKLFPGAPHQKGSIILLLRKLKN